MKPHSTNEQKLSFMHMCSMWIPVSSKWDWTPLAREAGRHRLKILCWMLWATSSSWTCPYSLQEGCTSWPLRGPSKSNCFMTLWIPSAYLGTRGGCVSIVCHWKPCSSSLRRKTEPKGCSAAPRPPAISTPPSQLQALWEWRLSGTGPSTAI